MAYYQILKQRRLDLNLSVQDVAIQTHLKPEYIRAIEDNNLDVFSDDFSYVRYFIHAYCDAIGVNWKAVVKEVDATVAAYATARDRALSQAQSRMIRSMPASKQTKASARKGSRRRKKSFLQHSAGRLSRLLNWDSRNRLAKTVIIAGVVLVAGLTILNYAAGRMSEKAREEARIAREQKLQEQEQRTEQMAQELREQKGEAEPEIQTEVPQISAVAEKNNTFTVLYSQRTSSTTTFSFETFKPCEILVYINDTPVYDQEVDGQAQYQARIPTGSTVHIYFKNPVPRDTLQVDGANVEVDMNLLTSNPDDGIVLQFQKGNSSESSQQTEEGKSENQTENQTESQTDNQTANQTENQTDIPEETNGDFEDTEGENE